MMVEHLWSGLTGSVFTLRLSTGIRTLSDPAPLDDLWRTVVPDLAPTLPSNRTTECRRLGYFSLKRTLPAA